MRTPLTLAIIQGFRVSVADQVYVVPLDSVVECVELPAEEVTPGVVGVLALRGRPLPYLRLHEIFGLPARRPGRDRAH